MSRPVLVAACLCAALLAPAASAQAQTTVTVPGVPAAGPAKYDKSFVTKIGPSSAKTVLVLVPGFSAGAGGFTLVGRDLVRQVPGLQVWALDRRSQALEDTSVFERGLKGQATPKQVFDYYLGWITDQSIQPRYQPPSTESLSFMSEWGLPTHIQDLRRVILSAKRQGKRVILGGHSLGASMTAIYAAWDFNGRPGYRDVDGLMLIDGGALGTFDDVETTAQIRRRLAQVREQPLADLVGVGLPWAQGIFTGLGGLYALKEPTALSPFGDYALLPQQFKPPVPATNRAFLGHAFDRDLPEGARADPPARRHAGAERRPARLGRRRGLPHRPRLRVLGGQPGQRRRVVLPAAPLARRRRRQRARAQPHHEGAEAPPVAPQEGRRADLRLPDRPDRGPHRARREALHRALEGPARAQPARRPREHDEPPRPADRGARDERLPEDGRPVDQAGSVSDSSWPLSSALSSVRDRRSSLR
jgi:hypothetical protein